MEHIKSNPLIRISLAILLILAVVSVVILRLELNDLKEHRDALSSSIELLEDDVSGLQKSLLSGLDDEYVIKIAKEKLNLRLSEEIIFYNDITD